MGAQKRHKIRILIADDHPMMLTGIKTVLSSRKHLEIVGEASNSEDAILQTKKLAPDIVLMDISMPVMNGMEATVVLGKQAPDVKVILLTMHTEQAYVAQFIKSGAHGYVVKSGSPDELLTAIEAVYGGGAFFSPAISQALLSEQRSGVGPSSGLTERELQVLTLLAKGLGNKQIADRLQISLRTVGKYREHIYMKLNFRSLADLTKYAIAQKLIEIDSN